jgi:hypothetical protein
MLMLIQKSMVNLNTMKKLVKNILTNPSEKSMTFKSGMNRPEPCRKNTFGCFLPLGESHAIYCVEGGLILTIYVS